MAGLKVDYQGKTYASKAELARFLGVTSCCLDRRIRAGWPEERWAEPPPKKTQLTTTEFIKRAKQIHGDFYDYSKTTYVRQGEKLIITCPIHGDFLSGYHHISLRSRCSKCARIFMHQKTLIERSNNFLKNAYLIHGDKYDYSIVKYKTARLKVDIICPIEGHGVFPQTPDSHLRNGCPKCGRSQAEESKWDDLSGEMFGRLKVLRFGHFKDKLINNRANPQRTGFWECICDCGRLVEIQTSSLKGNITRSCGCLRSEITALRNLALSIDGLSDPSIASTPTCLYFVEVENYFEKFGTTTESVEKRGKKEVSKNYYTKIYAERWLSRDVALPVEKVLLEKSKSSFNAREAVKRGLFNWGGWTETRVGLDISHWIGQIDELISQCKRVGYEKFLLNHLGNGWNSN